MCGSIFDDDVQRSVVSSSTGSKGNGRQEKRLVQLNQRKRWKTTLSHLPQTTHRLCRYIVRLFLDWLCKTVTHFYWVVQKAWIAVFQMDLEVSFYKKFQKISLKRADVDLNGWGAWKRCWTPSSGWMRTKGRQIGSRRQTLSYFSRLLSELCLQ